MGKVIPYFLATSLGFVVVVAWTLVMWPAKTVNESKKITIAKSLKSIFISNYQKDFGRRRKGFGIGFFGQKGFGTGVLVRCLLSQWFFGLWKTG